MQDVWAIERECNRISRNLVQFQDVLAKVVQNTQVADEESTIDQDEKDDVPTIDSFDRGAQVFDVVFEKGERPSPGPQLQSCFG